MRPERYNSPLIEIRTSGRPLASTCNGGRGSCARFARCKRGKVTHDENMRDDADGRGARPGDGRVALNARGEQVRTRSLIFLVEPFLVAVIQHQSPHLMRQPGKDFTVHVDTPSFPQRDRDKYPCMTKDVILLGEVVTRLFCPCRARCGRCDRHGRATARAR